MGGNQTELDLIAVTTTEARTWWTGLERSHLYRLLQNGDIDGATKTEDGSWSIPTTWLDDNFARSLNHPFHDGRQTVELNDDEARGLAAHLLERHDRLHDQLTQTIEQRHATELKLVEAKTSATHLAEAIEAAHSEIRGLEAQLAESQQEAARRLQELHDAKVSLAIAETRLQERQTSHQPRSRLMRRLRTPVTT